MSYHSVITKLSYVIPWKQYMQCFYIAVIYQGVIWHNWHMIATTKPRQTKFITQFWLITSNVDWTRCSIFNSFTVFMAQCLANEQRLLSCYQLSHLMEQRPRFLQTVIKVGSISIHSLIIWKLYAYGVSENACKLIASYLYKRKQRVKIGDEHSECVSQGSTLGPWFSMYSWMLSSIS